MRTNTHTHTHMYTHTCTHTRARAPLLPPLAGTPCVFYDHLKDEKNGLRKAILELIQVRKKNGLHARWVRRQAGAE